MPIRITGLNSGLDTEAIVSAMVSAYSVKKNKFVKAQTKLSWKQDAWKDLNKKVYSFYNNAGSMRFSTAYSLKKATVSDATKATVSASSTSASGTQSLMINHLATAGYLTGAKLSKSSVKSTMSDLASLSGQSAPSDGTLRLTLKGEVKEISVSADSTIGEVVGKLKDAGVNANYDEANQRIFISAKDTGAENDFSLVGGDAAGSQILGLMGLSVSDTSAADTAAYEKVAAYYDTDVATTKSNIKDLLNSLIEAHSNKDAAVTQKNTYASEKTAKQNEKTEAEKKLNYIKAHDAVIEAQTKYTDGGTTNIYDDLTAETPMSDDDLLAKYGDQGLTQEELDTLKEQIATKKAYEADDTNKSYVDLLDEQRIDDEVVIDSATAQARLESKVADADSQIATLDGQIAGQQSIIDANQAVLDDEDKKYWDSSLGDYTQYVGNDAKIDELATKITNQIKYSKDVVDGNAAIVSSTGATRINGTDATITLNGAEYTSNTNTFTINGLTINAMATTSEAITITTSTDTQGLYDKVKDFLSSYNSIINELTSLYNSESSGSYEPLTDEEKDAMTDSEIEKWEKKIKDGLLRRDGTIGDLISSMTNAMAKSYNINGKSYALSSFGIKTLGVLNSPQNQQNAFHIDGDADDDVTSGNADKLMAALSNDPDSIVDFMQKLSEGLYNEIGKKMKSTSISSIYTVYNDKEMASEYSSYSDLIKTWEKRITDMEDKYYKQFASMEKALATIQGNSSSLSSYMGQ